MTAILVEYDYRIRQFGQIYIQIDRNRQEYRYSNIHWNLTLRGRNISDAYII